MNIPGKSSIGDEDSATSFDLEESPPALQKTIGKQLSDAIQGNDEAQQQLIAIAQDNHASIEEREIVIRYLGQSGDPEFLKIVVKQLISEDPRMRTVAFYSLPKHIRPEGFDYTAKPNADSLNFIANLIDQI